MDAGPEADAGAQTDAGPDADAGPEADAGPQTDAGPDTDAGSRCRTVPDEIVGQCDGRGTQQCRQWAADIGGGQATAQCTTPNGRCARADTCTDAGCRCGAGPECGDDEMCVAGFAGFSCVCIGR